MQKKGRRELVYDHIIHSRLYDNTIYTGQYWDYMLPLAAAFKKPRILVIGLGGGTIPFQIRKKFGVSARVDVVEISREMERLSRAFLPEDPHARIILCDGLEYLRKTRSRYDVIISDPYISGEMPSEFFGAGFAEAASRALKPSGILGINLALTLRSMSKRRAMRRALGKEFTTYCLHYPGSSGNLVYVCSKKLRMGEMLERITANFSADERSAVLFGAYSKAR